MVDQLAQRQIHLVTVATLEFRLQILHVLHHMPIDGLPIHKHLVAMITLKLSLLVRPFVGHEQTLRAIFAAAHVTLKGRLRVNAFLVGVQHPGVGKR
jgi:hypothetical protein